MNIFQTLSIKHQNMDALRVHDIVSTVLYIGSDIKVSY